MMAKVYPVCLACGMELPREIKKTNMHDESCPWNYYIECGFCGAQNNLSKLLGFWAGCSDKCSGKGVTVIKIEEPFSLN